MQAIPWPFRGNPLDIPCDVWTAYINTVLLVHPRLQEALARLEYPVLDAFLLRQGWSPEIA